MTVAAEPVPFFTVRHDGESLLATEDRRTAARMRRKLPARVQIVGCEGAFNGTTDDVSEGGLRLCVCLDAGLSVGQRCEVTLASGDQPSRGDTVYATVVRTERVGDESERLLGIGLRFDQPLYL